jgi:hypothetical protein
VTTTHAKFQDLSLNPQKLAGQCSKLKCCLNFEVDCYLEAQRSFPSKEIPLETTESTAWFHKMEVHKGIYWYSTDPHSSANLIPVPVQRVKEIQILNRKGIKAEKLLTYGNPADNNPVSQDLLKDNSLTRFDPAPSENRRQRHPNKRKNRRFNDKRKS